jgi:methionyl aminopeptidase
MLEIKSPGEIDAMREAGRVVANALSAVRDAAAVGVCLRELDTIAHTVIRDAGATSPFLGYQPAFAPVPFPGVLCTSVNDAVVHGIPTDYRIADGDVVSIDCGATLDGWTGDAAVTFIVGTARPEDLTLIKTTQAALDAGIAATLAGNRIGDVAAAIGGVARPAGYGLLEGFGGHGIGRTMHEDPAVPNDGKPGRGVKLRPGLVIAIEPMLMTGGRDSYTTDRDGWTLHTDDRSRAAHIEHTVAVTADGPRILTLP